MPERKPPIKSRSHLRIVQDKEHSPHEEIRILVEAIAEGVLERSPGASSEDQANIMGTQLATLAVVFESMVDKERSDPKRRNELSGITTMLRAFATMPKGAFADTEAVKEYVKLHLEQLRDKARDESGQSLSR